MGTLKLTDVSGVGAVTAGKLEALGVGSVVELARTPTERVAEITGFPESRAGSIIQAAAALAGQPAPAGEAPEKKAAGKKKDKKKGKKGGAKKDKKKGRKGGAEKGKKSDSKKGKKKGKKGSAKKDRKKDSKKKGGKKDKKKGKKK